MRAFLFPRTSARDLNRSLVDCKDNFRALHDAWSAKRTTETRRTALRCNSHAQGQRSNQRGPADGATSVEATYLPTRNPGRPRFEDAGFQKMDASRNFRCRLPARENREQEPGHKERKLQEKPQPSMHENRRQPMTWPPVRSPTTPKPPAAVTCQ